MKRPELYHKTVDILVQAYFNDTLQHTNCFACAVGNICAANSDIKYKITDYGEMVWAGYEDRDIYITPTYYCLSNSFDTFRLVPVDVEYIRKRTGYSWDELSEIEFAFENCDSKGDWMFDGLMAVIDALDRIHKNKDRKATTTSKQKFNRCSPVERSVASEA